MTRCMRSVSGAQLLKQERRASENSDDRNNDQKLNERTARGIAPQPLFARVIRNVWRGAGLTKITNTQSGWFHSSNVAVVKKPVEPPVMARRIVCLAGCPDERQERR